MNQLILFSEKKPQVELKRKGLESGAISIEKEYSWRQNYGLFEWEVGCLIFFLFVFFQILKCFHCCHLWLQVRVAQELLGQDQLQITRVYVQN